MYGDFYFGVGGCVSGVWMGGWVGRGEEIFGEIDWLQNVQNTSKI